MTKTTKTTTTTACEAHGLPGCAACVKTPKGKRAEEDLTLATVPTVVRFGSGAPAPMVPTSGRSGARAVLAPVGADAERVSRASALPVPTDMVPRVFGSTVVPDVASVTIGRETKTGRPAKGSTRVTVSLEPELRDGRAVGRIGQTEVEHDGRPYVVRARVRVGRNAWHVSASVSPGRAPARSTKTATTADALPFLTE